MLQILLKKRSQCKLFLGVLFLGVAVRHFVRRKEVIFADSACGPDARSYVIRGSSIAPICPQGWRELENERGCCAIPWNARG
jgi:hypothetical protein